MTTQVDLKNLVRIVTNDLLKVNNTVSTLEVKTELRKRYSPYYWTQKIVSDFMDEMYNNGELVFKDNGTFREYSDPTKVKVAKVKAVPVKGGKISRKQALELMKNNKGHFFTATFTKKNGDLRTINCQYLKDQTNIELGYVKVKESGKAKKGENAVRNVNLQTLSELRIAGAVYTIK